LKKVDLDRLPLNVTKEHLNKHPSLARFAKSQSLSDQKERKGHQNFQKLIKIFVDM